MGGKERKASSTLFSSESEDESSGSRSDSDGQSSTGSDGSHSQDGSSGSSHSSRSSNSSHSSHPSESRNSDEKSGTKSKAESEESEIKEQGIAISEIIVMSSDASDSQDPSSAIINKAKLPPLHSSRSSRSFEQKRKLSIEKQSATVKEASSLSLSSHSAGRGKAAFARRKNSGSEHSKPSPKTNKPKATNSTLSGIATGAKPVGAAFFKAMLDDDSDLSSSESEPMKDTDDHHASETAAGGGGDDDVSVVSARSTRTASSVRSKLQELSALRKQQKQRNSKNAKPTPDHNYTSSEFEIDSSDIDSKRKGKRGIHSPRVPPPPASDSSTPSWRRKRSGAPTSWSKAEEATPLSPPPFSGSTLSKTPDVTKQRKIRKVNLPPWVQSEGKSKRPSEMDRDSDTASKASRQSSANSRTLSVSNHIPRNSLSSPQSYVPERKLDTSIHAPRIPASISSSATGPRPKWQRTLSGRPTPPWLNKSSRDVAQDESIQKPSSPSHGSETMPSSKASESSKSVEHLDNDSIKPMDSEDSSKKEAESVAPDETSQEEKSPSKSPSSPETSEHQSESNKNELLGGSTYEQAVIPTDKDELAQLIKDIQRVGVKGQPQVTFGELFDDPQVEQFYEALVGTLLMAKKRKLVNFKGQMLLKGAHDDVVISIHDESDESDDEPSRGKSSPEQLPKAIPAITSDDTDSFAGSEVEADGDNSDDGSDDDANNEVSASVSGNDSGNVSMSESNSDNDKGTDKHEMSSVSPTEQEHENENENESEVSQQYEEGNGIVTTSENEAEGNEHDGSSAGDESRGIASIDEREASHSSRIGSDATSSKSQSNNVEDHSGGGSGSQVSSRNEISVEEDESHHSHHSSEEPTDEVRIEEHESPNSSNHLSDESTDNEIEYHEEIVVETVHENDNSESNHIEEEVISSPASSHDEGNDPSGIEHAFSDDYESVPDASETEVSDQSVIMKLKGGTASGSVNSANSSQLEPKTSHEGMPLTNESQSMESHMNSVHTDYSEETFTDSEVAHSDNSEEINADIETANLVHSVNTEKMPQHIPATMLASPDRRSLTYTLPDTGNQMSSPGLLYTHRSTSSSSEEINNDESELPKKSSESSSSSKEGSSGSGDTPENQESNRQQSLMTEKMANLRPPLHVDEVRIPVMRISSFIRDVSDKSAVNSIDGYSWGLPKESDRQQPNIEQEMQEESKQLRPLDDDSDHNYDWASKKPPSPDQSPKVQLDKNPATVKSHWDIVRKQFVPSAGFELEQKELNRSKNVDVERKTRWDMVLQKFVPSARTELEQESRTPSHQQWSTLRRTFITQTKDESEFNPKNSSWVPVVHASIDRSRKMPGLNSVDGTEDSLSLSSALSQMPTTGTAIWIHENSTPTQAQGDDWIPEGSRPTPRKIVSPPSTPPRHVSPSSQSSSSSSSGTDEGWVPSATKSKFNRVDFTGAVFEDGATWSPPALEQASSDSDSTGGSPSSSKPSTSSSGSSSGSGESSDEKSTSKSGSDSGTSSGTSSSEDTSNNDDTGSSSKDSKSKPKPEDENAGVLPEKEDNGVTDGTNEDANAEGATGMQNKSVHSQPTIGDVVVSDVSASSYEEDMTSGDENDDDNEAKNASATSKDLMSISSHSVRFSETNEVAYSTLSNSAFVVKNVMQSPPASAQTAKRNPVEDEFDDLENGSRKTRSAGGYVKAKNTDEDDDDEPKGSFSCALFLGVICCLLIVAAAVTFPVGIFVLGWFDDSDSGSNTGARTLNETQQVTFSPTESTTVLTPSPVVQEPVSPPTQQPVVAPTAILTRSPTQAPIVEATLPPRDVLVDLISGVVPDGGASLLDISSPQFIAMQWVRTPNNQGIYNDARFLERYALATLYYGAQGDIWTTNQLWLTAANECSWFGVVDCNDEGRITHLDLSDNQIRGTIPEEFVLLESLEILELSDNLLSGTIPTWLGTMSSLKRLEVYKNELTGNVPTQLGQLLNLTLLDLGSNLLEGVIPPQLGELTRLEGLSVFDNPITGTVPTQLASITGLRQIFLDQTSLNAPIPIGFCNLRLREFWADCTEVGCTCCTKCCIDGEVCS